MRLERLEISGFGRLRDLDVHFHSQMTVILGDNESGKSTLLRAVRAALYSLDAGGQGRAVERSDWQRYFPWTAGPYGLALTYALGNGKRYRVAARLDKRPSSVQVQELGGGDVTDAMRQNRIVAPGVLHLGLDEPVFAATAWLGDGGLLLGSPEAAGAHAAALQEAVERLADTGKGTSAADAIARLRDAQQRVGSERRISSPLGVAVARLSELDRQIVDARRRLNAVADERERLRRLDAATAEADAHRLDCERAWLRGMLASVAQQQADLVATSQEEAEVQTVITQTSHFADFPADESELALTLAAEHQQSRLALGEAQQRCAAQREVLHKVRRRRNEIDAGLHALGPAIVITDAVHQSAAELERDISEEIATLRRLEAAGATEARCAALRQEIAATGLGALAPGTADSVRPLLDAILDRGSVRTRRNLGGATLAALAVVSALILHNVHRDRWALLAGGALGAAAVALSLFIEFRSRNKSRLYDQLRHLWPDLDMTPEGLLRAAQRLPNLAALHKELLRQEALTESIHEEAARTEQRVRAQLDAAIELLLSVGLEIPPQITDRISRAEQCVVAARLCLDRLQEAVLANGRRMELQKEGAELAAEEASLTMLEDEVERRSAQMEAIESRLRRLLDAAGIGRHLDIVHAVRAFRNACDQRRAHESAQIELAALQRRRHAMGLDAQALQRRRAAYTIELSERGGSPAEAAAAQPLDALALQRLEREVEHARQASIAAGTEATALRARLGGVLEHLPSLADLEDERAACIAARDRAVRQRAALQRAVEFIENATRDVHRELAPQLAEHMGSRLIELSEGRYSQVNVDTDHFAIALHSSERPELVPLDLVSHGTRDQVSLLLRLALADILGRSGERAPIVLDEPMLTADPRRRAVAFGFLASLSATHQLIVTASDPAWAAELQAAAGSNCATFTMPGSADAAYVSEIRGHAVKPGRHIANRRA